MATADRESGPPVRPLTTIRLLQLEDVSRLRPTWWSRWDQESVAGTLMRYPGRSVWNPETLEFALIGAWRHRDEISHVLELLAVSEAERLLRAAIEASDAAGAAVLVAVESDESRPPGFYRRVGMEPIEEVIAMDLAHPGEPRLSNDVEIRPVTMMTDAELSNLLVIDHAAFPFIWRNSSREFDSYLSEPGVELYIGSVDGVPLGYVGISAYLGWGHIDRVAVHPRAQGQGLGRTLTRFAIGRLARLGARTVGLSTQGSNGRAQRLYESLGFRRTHRNDYRVYGAWLSAAERPLPIYGDDPREH